MMPLSTEQRKMVLDSAINLFAGNHIGDITVEKLAKASGVSIFDIVRHYQSRDNILIAVLERELETMAAAANAPELRFPGETLKDELHVLADVILQEYRNRLPFLRKMLAEALESGEIGAVFYRTFIVQGRLLFAEFLRERNRLGELRDDLDLEAAAAIFLAALTGALWTVEFFGGKHVETLDYERLCKQLADVFLDGVKRR
jgi:AcrR family transcriptional regulator